MKKFNINEVYELPEDNEIFQFLDKNKIQLPKEVEIIEIYDGVSRYKPRFLGKFDFGKYMFDLPIEQMKIFTEKYGNNPNTWKNQKMIIKSYRYENKKKIGLTIKIEKFL